MFSAGFGNDWKLLFRSIIVVASVDDDLLYHVDVYEFSSLKFKFNLHHMESWLMVGR